MAEDTGHSAWRVSETGQWWKCRQSQSLDSPTSAAHGDAPCPGLWIGHGGSSKVQAWARGRVLRGGGPSRGDLISRAPCSGRNAVVPMQMSLLPWKSLPGLPPCFLSPIWASSLHTFSFPLLLCHVGMKLPSEAKQVLLNSPPPKASAKVDLFCG
jgi:hypothetical protein